MRLRLTKDPINVLNSGAAWADLAGRQENPSRDVRRGLHWAICVLACGRDPPCSLGARRLERVWAENHPPETRWIVMVVDWMGVVGGDCGSFPCDVDAIVGRRARRARRAGQSNVW